MKPKEAIRIIKRMDKETPTPRQNEALKMAYAALNKEEKQKVQKKLFRNARAERYVCPTCGCMISPNTSEAVCRFCGQKVDWSTEITSGKVGFGWAIRN